MCLHDFTMDFLGVRIPAGGVGQVAVDLLHKKEHVAKEMMAYSPQHYQETCLSWPSTLSALIFMPT
jgi:predicted acetyltransferase